MAKLNFQCHMILQKLFQYADLVLRKDYLLLMLKTDVWLNIFVQTLIHFCRDTFISNILNVYTNGRPIWVFLTADIDILESRVADGRYHCI